MQTEQGKQFIVILDPFSSRGISLAKDIIAKGYVVQLFLDKQLTDEQELLNLKVFQSSLVIYDILESCESNNLEKLFVGHLTKILCIRKEVLSDWIFDTYYDFSQAHRLLECQRKFLQLAEQNSIQIEYIPSNYQYTSVFEELVSKIFEFICNDQKRLYVNSLDFNIIYSLDDNKSEDIDDHQDYLLNEGSFSLGFRDLIKLVFECIGAEIEFCGRNENERGVIVDYDEQILLEAGVYSEKIKLGNTIIKINESKGNLVYPILNDGDIPNLDVSKRDFVLQNINGLIKSIIAK